MSRSVLWRWLPGLFAARMGIVTGALLGLYAIGEVFDKLRYLDARFTTGRLVEYIVLRMPETLARHMALVVLLGAWIALVELAMHRENLALRAIGCGPRRVLPPLMLLAAAAGALAFVLMEEAMPATKRAAYMERVFIRHARLVATDARWLHDGHRFFRIAPLGQGVFRVLVLEVDDVGRWRRWIEAERARFHAGVWHLEGVRIQARAAGGMRELALPALSLPSRVAPSVREPPPPSRMRLGELGAYIRLLAQAGAPTEGYRYAWHRRIALALEPIVAMLCAFALGFHLHARAGGVTLSAAGALAAAAWLFLGAQLGGLFAGAGAWPAWFAAWWPGAVLGLLSLGVLLRKEGY